MPKRSGSSADADPSDEALAAELAMVKEAAAQAKAALVEAQRCSLEAEERVREVELRISSRRRKRFVASGLLNIAAVQRAFLFLDGPAEVLRAAATCHRWHELATADSVWRARFEREGMVEKAGVFEVPLPAEAAAAASGGGAGGGGSSSAAPRDKLAGVGLAFYAQIYVLQVTPAELFV